MKARVFAVREFSGSKSFMVLTIAIATQSLIVSCTKNREDGGSTTTKITRYEDKPSSQSSSDSPPSNLNRRIDRRPEELPSQTNGQVPFDPTQQNIAANSPNSQSRLSDEQAMRYRDEVLEMEENLTTLYYHYKANKLKKKYYLTSTIESKIEELEDTSLTLEEYQEDIDHISSYIDPQGSDERSKWFRKKTQELKDLLKDLDDETFDRIKKLKRMLRKANDAEEDDEE